jgi:heme o synthase
LLPKNLARAPPNGLESLWNDVQKLAGTFKYFRNFKESSNRFTKFAAFVLVYNLLAVAWGVFVRAGKYGDGCGSHWPLCDGNSQPLMGEVARIIEMSHRITTALCGPMALGLLFWAFISYPKGHLVRVGAVATFVMTLVEGAIGGLLVKFQLVVQNESAVRAGFMAGHAVSTFVLLGSILLTLMAATGISKIEIRGQGPVGPVLLMGFFGSALLGVSGSISALGHQLHPTDNVLQAALNPTTFWMVRMQPLHPLISISVGLFLTLAGGLLVHLRPDPNVKRSVDVLLGLYAFQVVVGALNIWLKAPIGMQMFHLAMADLNFLAFVAVSVFALRPGVERVEQREAPTEAVPDGPIHGRDLVNAYIALTKPRVISLLLFTTLTAAIAAKGEWPGATIFFSLFVGGYMCAGAANAINMVIDRDIDFAMKRTAKRPTVTQSIPSRNVLTFAFLLTVGSFVLLWWAANLLTAVMAFSGLVFYVVIYTLLLKRRTWHNIVIGGAAGAFPPLVGWAAVTNDLPPLALYLFAIVFVWTPVHFWALALLLKDDYAQAGVPMLPVVKGDKTTVNQIALYAIATVAVTMAPLLFPNVGWMYGLSALVLNVILLRYTWNLKAQIDRPRASALFHYSMLYLAILFAVFAADRVIVLRNPSASQAPLPVTWFRSNGDRQSSQVLVKVALSERIAECRLAERDRKLILGPSLVHLENV